jgi:hypothetical protein
MGGNGAEKSRGVNPRGRNYFPIDGTGIVGGIDELSSSDSNFSTIDMHG